MPFWIQAAILLQGGLNTKELFGNLTLAFNVSFMQVILPSSLLNLLLAIPVHALIRDLANRVYPGEVVP